MWQVGPHEQSMNWQFQQQMQQMRSTMQQQMEAGAQQMRQAQQHSFNVSQELGMHFQEARERMEQSLRNTEFQMQQAARHAAQAQASLMRQAQMHQSQAATSGLNGIRVASSNRGGGVSTSVVNGVVSVNGEQVARVPRGQPVQISNVNGIVYLNGQLIWPRQLAPDAPEPMQAVLGHRSREAWLDHCLISICEKDRTEVCPICLDDIRCGQYSCTLPCFHFLHRHCAEAYFDQSANGQNSGPALCPVCRVRVGPELIEIPDDDM